MAEQVRFHHDEEHPVLDPYNASDVAAMRGFALGDISPREAGPAFSLSAEGSPVIDISEGLFDRLTGANEDNIVRGEN